MQIKFAIPSPISKVTRIENKESLNTTHFDEGFQAGYQAGQWQARLEQTQWIEQERKNWKQTLETLTALHTECEKTIVSEFPHFIQTILEKLFKNNPFTPEKVAAEIDLFLHELGQAQTIQISCAPADLETIQKICEKTGTDHQQGSLQWKANPELTAGEFKIQSDLGSVDGRLQPKITKLKAALEKP